MSGRRLSGERGSATVWVVAVSAVLALVGIGTVLMGAAAVARHRAGAAADLAALAAAGRSVVGDAAPCAAATAVARAQAAELTRCDVGAGGVVDVQVRVPVRLGPLGLEHAVARARAGPAAAAGHPDDVSGSGGT